MKPNQLSLLTFFLFILPFLLVAQPRKKSPWQWGLQSGVNLNVLHIEENPVDKEAFLGLVFGVIGQKKLFTWKLQWARLERRVFVYFETGLLATRSGYQYRYRNQINAHEQFGFEMPLTFVLKTADKRQHRNMRKKGIEFIWTYGTSLTWRPEKTISNEYSDPNGAFTLKEKSTQTNKLRLLFYTGFGLEKKHKNGSRTYTGISAHLGAKPTTEGTVLINENGQEKMGYIVRRDYYFSIDCKYFPASKRDRERLLRKQRDPIIYNPRF